METHKILDRFEMLYPLNSKIADLRRACIDKDLHSVFRLINDDTKEDLRKTILEDNQWSLWKILDSYVDTRFVQSLKSFEVQKVKWDEDCFSQGQIKSKMWILQELRKLNLDLGVIFLCAGWYSTLATMLFESKVKVDKIRSFDIDESCVAYTFRNTFLNVIFILYFTIRYILRIRKSQKYILKIEYPK